MGFFDYSRATLAGVCGKPSDQIRCRSQPNQLHVRSNPIPEFSGYYGGFCHYPPVGRCIIPIFALGWQGKKYDPTWLSWLEIWKNEVVARVDLAADWAHDDTACVRMLTESGIMLWRHRLVSVISSKSLTECYARNLRPETWRWWLSGPEKTSVLRPTRKSTIWSY